MKKQIHYKCEAGVIIKNNGGFTLVELLVAMAISLIVMGSIYSVYRSQQKSYIAQEQVAMMQQNLRAGMTMMTRDIRMAGYDPTTVSVAVGITVANSDELEVERMNDALTATETIKYSLEDKGPDGDNDLVRDDGGGSQLVAENIDALNFVYLDQTGTVLDDDGSGNVTTSIPNIRSIQVTMVARTGRVDLGYTDNNTYQNQQDQNIYTPPANDRSFRRRALSREIKCRNLGI